MPTAIEVPRPPPVRVAYEYTYVQTPNDVWLTELADGAERDNSDSGYAVSEHLYTPCEEKLHEAPDDSLPKIINATFCEQMLTKLTVMTGSAN